MRGHGRLLTAAALTAAGLLTGCSGATTSARTTATHELPPTASGTTAGSATTPPTPTTGPAAPSSPATTTAATPAAARAHTPEGAEAFTHYWVQTINGAWRAGAGRPILELSTPACESCKQLAADADRFTHEKKRLRSDPLKLVSVTRAGADQSGRERFIVVTRQLPAPVLNPDGTIFQTLAEVENRSDVALAYTPAGWRVAEIGSGR
ncbi:DUF6318 family protein [uncultured Arsenicicoccus sp.]|uniref:DUF6318 family protein n=1 Tax=uncultured Arsenicicoccus sp. TaxID=491339 RepID=UPI00338E7D8D